MKKLILLSALLTFAVWGIDGVRKSMDFQDWRTRVTNSDLRLIPNGTGATTTEKNIWLQLQSAIRFYGSGTGSYASLEAPAAVVGGHYKLPSNDGTANQLLKTDGSGNMSWGTAAGGGENFLSDGGFEGGLNFTCNHANQTCAQVTSPNYDPGGLNVAKIDASSSSTYDAEYCVTNTEFEGNDFDVSCMMKTTSTLINLCASNDSGTGDVCADYIPNTASEWIEIKSSMTAPASGKLCIRITSDSGTTDDVFVDKCKINNQVVNFSPIFSSWTAYTPDIIGFGTETSVNFEWRRVGENMEVRGRFASGSPTATEARIPLPSPYVTRIPSTSIVGFGGRANASASTPKQYIINAITTGLSYVTVSFGHYTPAVSPLTTQNGDLPLSINGEFVYFNFSVPILGWSSGSNFLAQNVSGNAVLYSTNATQSIGSGGSAAIVDFEDKSQDETSEVTTGASWKYTAKETGDFLVCPLILFDTAVWVAGEVITLQAYIDGVGDKYFERYEVPSSRSGFLPTIGKCETFHILSGHYIDVRVQQNSTGSRSLNSSSLLNTISIQRIDKKGIIAASLREKLVVPGINSPILVSASVTSTEVVTELGSENWLGTCTDADPSVCSFTVGYWNSEPNCWADADGGGGAGADVTNTDGTTSVDVNRVNNGVAFKVFCLGVKN